MVIDGKWLLIRGGNSLQLVGDPRWLFMAVGMQSKLALSTTGGYARQVVCEFRWLFMTVGL